MKIHLKTESGIQCLTQEDATKLGSFQNTNILTDNQLEVIQITQQEICLIILLMEEKQDGKYALKLCLLKTLSNTGFVFSYHTLIV